MPYTYLDIVNDVLESFNEVALDSTSGSNGFVNATGFHQHIKNKVNSAISDIYISQDYEWPFALTEGSQVLTVGFTGAVAGAIPEYTLPVGQASVDWESFYIVRNESLANPSQVGLKYLNWDNYVTNYRDLDANTSLTSVFQKPTYVVRKPNGKYIIGPLADLARTVKFNYYAIPTVLTLYTDVPSIPEVYRQVITDRVLQFGYMFRDNKEEADKAEADYERGLEYMRRALVPQSDTLRFADGLW